MTHWTRQRRVAGKKCEQKNKEKRGTGILATSRFGGSGRASDQRSRYTADEVMLALANQKIGHEARDYFRSRTGVDFYFGSITRLVGRARGRDFVPVHPNRKVPEDDNAGHCFGQPFFFFPFFSLSVFRNSCPPSISSLCFFFEQHRYACPCSFVVWPDKDGNKSSHRTPVEAEQAGSESLELG